MTLIPTRFSLTSDELRKAVKNRRILVTGAGGSIGSELVRLAAQGSPTELILVSHSELSLYNIFNEVKAFHPDVTLIGVLGDIRDAKRMENICTTHRPDVIFHAAAIKHVPLAEDNPCEAILTNVGGTRNIYQAARRIRCHLVFVSTDKAVEPNSVMGMTKRVAELYLASKEGITVSIVRFGNVLGTSGSVLPLFQKQIAQGKEITITHKDVDRYFMHKYDAAALLLKAAQLHLNDGKVRLYILNMGTPVKIIDLARYLMETVGVEVPIRITGLRPGEKITEKLFFDDEQERAFWLDSRLMESSIEKRNHVAMLDVVKRLLYLAEQGLAPEAHELLEATTTQGENHAP